MLRCGKIREMVVLRELSRAVIPLFAAVQLKGDKREGGWVWRTVGFAQIIALISFCFAPHLKVAARRTSLNEGTSYILSFTLCRATKYCTCFFQLPTGVSKLRESDRIWQTCASRRSQFPFYSMCWLPDVLRNRYDFFRQFPTARDTAGATRSMIALSER